MTYYLERSRIPGVERHVVERYFYHSDPRQSGFTIHSKRQWIGIALWLEWGRAIRDS